MEMAVNIQIYPNSFDEMEIRPKYKEPPLPLNSHFADWYDRNCEGRMTIIPSLEIYLKS
jgi:hypothetical protein